MFKFEDNDNKVFCIKDSNVELSATFENLPKNLDTITIEWTRDGKPITNSEKFKVTKTKNAIQLAIQHVQRDDAGHYTLYAKTDTGETAQKDIELVVEDRSFGDNPPVFIRRLNDLAVKVGTRTRLLVEIRSATDVRVTWYRNDRRICENDRINFVNEGSFYCLEISSITLDDGGKWMCMAENLGGRNSCLATLNVLVPKAYKAPEFVEELRAILTEQGTVSLECKVVGVPTPILRWFKDSKEIKAGDVFALTANPDDLTSLGTYTCEAVNCMGKTYSSSKLHISGRASREGSLQPSNKSHGPPPIFTSELKNMSSKIGDSITLGCQVMVPPWPKTVAWYNKEGKIESSEKYKLIEDGLGSYILEIKPAEYGDEGEWKFVVTSSEGTVSISTCFVQMDIPKNYRKPRFMENLKAILTEEGLVSFECKVVGFPTPLLRWFKDGHELKPGDVYQLTGTNSLGSYSCIARNCMGEACSSAVLTLEDIQNQLNENERIELQQKNQPPKFIKGLMSCETKINEEFKFTVQIKATTEPVFSWYRDDLPIDKINERYEISNEKVGLCHLVIKCVEFVDQAEWKCIATNEYGHSTSTCFLKLQIPRHFKKPRFLECLRAVLTEEGAVNLECKVIGVPQPTLRWFKDGVELKPGDIHRIISGKDGECSLGTYTCEARNCMGIVTSSATLLGYEENYKALPKPEPANILQRHLSLSTIHEERTSQLYDTPMGDITVDEKGDVSFSFDGKEVSVSLYETPDLTEEEALQIIEMYADQISENVTEQNIVELPPLRFVKETTQSGNLLMEAVVIDVSPDYFPPEEDMRTEADMEDISVVDPLSQGFEDPLSEQSLSKRRRKEESLKSGEVEEFFSLSQSKQTKPLSILDNYIVEEAHSDEEITETDLQTFESAKSSQKGDSDKQKKAGIKSDDSLQEQPPKLPPRKRPATENKDEDSLYLQDISGEQGDGLKMQAKKKSDVKTVTINKSIIEQVIKTVIIVKQHLIAVENEVIAQSSLMMSPTSGDGSIGIIKSVLEPINAIECKVNEYNGERNVEKLIENLLPDLKNLNHGLSIIEKCVEMDSEGRTLVQRTSVCVIESVGVQMLTFLENIKQVCLNNVQGSLQNESLLIINDMQTGIHITEDTIKSQTLMQEASAIEVSQRVSESVAQMQQSVQETVPLEVVTTSEMPKEANSFKLLCRYILKFQEILEMSQHNDVKKETLIEIQKPIFAIQNEIHSIEEKISKNSLKDTIEEKISFKILDTVSPPLYELNKCFEAITKNVECGNKNPKILDSFILPLQEIQTGLALIGHEIDSGFIKKESPIDTEDNQKLIKNVSQNVIYFESNIENIRETTSMTVYDSLIQLKTTVSKVIEKINREPLTKGNLQIIWALKIPLEELNYCFRHIEERSTSGSLRDLLDPLNSLKENMEVVEEKLRQMRISSNVDELKIIKNLVDQCDAEIQLFDIIQLDQQERMNQKRMFEQQLSEQSQHLSEMQQRSSRMQEKCNVLTSVEKNIVNIQEIIGFENDNSFSEHLSTLKTLALPLRELARQIANIREEILLENVNDISINDYKSILKLANPIREICQQLAIVTKASTLESAQVFSSLSGQEALKSLAVPLAELRNCIAAIQHECITLHEIQGEISHPQINLKTARPLEELRLRVDEIIHNIVEPDEISTTLDDVSVMKTMSEMPEDIKDESSQNKVTVTETKVEEAQTHDKEVIEIKQVETKCTDVTEQISKESQENVEIKLETIKTVEVNSEATETKHVTEKTNEIQESVKTVDVFQQQEMFEDQLKKFSPEIQTHLVKAREESETVMIAIENLRKPTDEILAVEKEIKVVHENILSLPNDVKEISNIIESIERAEKSVASRKTSNVILVKYNLDAFKKTLISLIKTIQPDYVQKHEDVMIHEEKEIKVEVSSQKEEMAVETVTEEITKEQSKVETHTSATSEDFEASLTQVESQVKKIKLLIKKASEITELQAVEKELTMATENITNIADSLQKFDKAIEVIEIAESKLIADKSIEMVEIKDNLATLKQILIILKSSASTQQIKPVDENIKENSQIIEASKEIQTVDDSITKVVSDKIEEKSIEYVLVKQVTSDNLEVKANDKPVEIPVPKESEEKSQTQKEVLTSEQKSIEIPEQKSTEIQIEEVKPVEISAIAEQKIAEVKVEETSIEQRVTVEKSDEVKIAEPEILQQGLEQKSIEIVKPQQILETVEKTIESIKKVRRSTPEVQAIERQLSTTFENIKEIPSDEKVIDEMLSSIETAEASITVRKTSDIAVLKENFATLKQSLVTLRTTIVQQKAQSTDIEAQPQKAEIGVIESEEVLKIIEPKEELKITDENKPKVEESKKDEKAIQTTEHVSKAEIIEEIKIEEKAQDSTLEIEKCLSKAKEEIENVTLSISKTSKPTEELQAVQNELIDIIEKLSKLTENTQQIEKAIESIEKAESSLIAKKTGDVVLVKQNLSNLKQVLVTLNIAVKTYTPGETDLKLKAQKAEFSIIETSEELKIVESNECIAETITENIEEKITEEKQVASETLELRAPEPEEKPAMINIENTKTDEKPSDLPKVEEPPTVELPNPEKILETSKETVQKTIESIKNVRRSTPEVQAIERQLSTTFENIKEIPSDEKVIDEMLSSIETAEASIAVRKTSDIVVLKENFATLKQSLVTLRATIVQQKAQSTNIEAQPQKAEIGVIDSNEELKIIEPKEELKITDEDKPKIEEKHSVQEMQTVEKVTLITAETPKTEEQKDAIEPKTEEVTALKIEEPIEEKSNEYPESPNDVKICLSKTKLEIENVTASIKKSRRPTSEVQAVQDELNTVLEKLSELPENLQQIEKVIESIQKAESSLISKKTSDAIIVKENLANLKQSLVHLRNVVKTQKIEVQDIQSKSQIGELKIFETSEELRIVESNESLIENIDDKKVQSEEKRLESVEQKAINIEHKSAEEEIGEKAKLIQSEPEQKIIDTEIKDSIMHKSELEPLPEGQVLEHVFEKSKESAEQTIEIIKKVPQSTPEVQAIERQLSASFENIKEIKNNEKVVDEILSSIEAAEASIDVRKTSEIAVLKENFAALKQSLVTLRITIVQQKGQVSYLDAHTQKAELGVIENKEELKISESTDHFKEEQITSIEEKQQACDLKIEEPTESIVQKIVDSPEPTNEIKICLSKTKTEIENVSASIKKSRRPTSEVQAVQNELNTVLEKLGELPNNQEQILKVIESIEKAELSLAVKKTSDAVLVKENLTNLKQSLITLNSSIKSQKGEEQNIKSIPQIGELKIFEDSEELKIIESNESLAEKVDEKILKVEEKTQAQIKEPKQEVKTSVDQKSEENKIEDVKPVQIPSISEQKIADAKIEEQDVEQKTEEFEILDHIVLQAPEQKPMDTTKVDKILETSKETAEKTIESIKKVRRSTPEVQAIERQLSTTFENIKEIPSDEIVIDEMLSSIETAEASIAIRKTSDIAVLKENFATLKQSLVTLRTTIVQQKAQSTDIEAQPQKAELSVIESKEVLKITELQDEVKQVEKANDLEIVQEEIKIDSRKTEELKEIKTMQTDEVKSKEIKVDEIITEDLKTEQTKTDKSEKLETQNEKVLENVSKEVRIEEIKDELPKQEVIQDNKIEEQKTPIEICLTKAKEDIESVTISIKKARRPTDELQAAEKELILILENISQLPENQQQIEKALEKIESAEVSLMARRTSDITLVKENLNTLKKSLVTLNNTIKSQKIVESAVNKLPQIGNLQIIEAPEELKIVESNESLAEKVDERIAQLEEKVTDEQKLIEIPKDVVTILQQGETTETALKEQSTEEKNKELLPSDIFSDEINVDFCIKKSKTDIEDAMASIKLVRRPTSELQAAEKELTITLEKLSELPENQQLIDKALQSIETAEVSLAAKKTCDMILVKQGLMTVKQSLVLFKDTIKSQQPKDSDIPSNKQVADLQIIDTSDSLKIVESNEIVATGIAEKPLKTSIEKSLEKSKEKIENVVESIKKTRRPTVEVQAIEKQLVTTLEHLSDLQKDENKIENVIESIVAAETSLTAKMTKDAVLVKENLSNLKESLTILKTEVESQKIIETDGHKNDEKIDDLKIVESNEDLTITNESPKVEELEGLHATETEQPEEVAFSLSKSREEIENVMFSIRKARHPPSEVNAVEKILTATYEQLFEIPKDEKIIDKAIESIELAEISLVPRGAGDLLVIKSNLATLKESLINVISFTNPQKAKALLNEHQKPQIVEVAEIQEEKTIKDEKPQDMTNLQKLGVQIESTVESIRKSRRPTAEVQAIEKEFTATTIEKVNNLENDKQEIEKVIQLIEMAESSLTEKRTSDIVLIKENLTSVKETLNTIKLTAKFKSIEIIEAQQQKPEQTILVDEKLKTEDVRKEIADEKTIEVPQASIELKENESKLSSQREIQSDVNVEKLKTEMDNVIHSIKKARRPTTEMQAVERELTIAIENVNEISNDGKIIGKLIEIIQNTEASLVARKTSDIALVKNNLGGLKETMNAIKNAFTSETSEIIESTIDVPQIIQNEVKATETKEESKVLEISKVDEKISEVSEPSKTQEAKPQIKPETKDEPKALENLTVDEKITEVSESTKTEKAKPKIKEKSDPEIITKPKETQEIKKPTEETKPEQKVEEKLSVTLSPELQTLKSEIENSLQSIKNVHDLTAELEDTAKVLSVAIENIVKFSSNDDEILKAVESIAIVQSSLIAKKTSDITMVKSCLGSLRDKFIVMQNKIKPKKPEAKKIEKPAVIDEIKPDEPKKIEEKALESKVKQENEIQTEEKREEQQNKIEDKPTTEIKKSDEESIKLEQKTKEEQVKPIEDEKKPKEKIKAQEKLPAELSKVKIEINDTIDAMKKARRPTNEMHAVEKELTVILEKIKDLSSSQQEITSALSSIEVAELSLTARRTSDIILVKEKLNLLKQSLNNFKVLEKIEETKVESKIEPQNTNNEGSIKPDKTKEGKDDVKIEEKVETKEEIKEVTKKHAEDVKTSVEAKPIDETPSKAEEVPAVPETATIRKLRREIESVSATIKKVRRPTPELQTFEAELTIALKKLPEVENEIQEIEKLINLITTTEDSIITKRTSDILAVKESFTSLKNTLMKLSESKKPKLEEQHVEKPAESVKSNEEEIIEIKEVVNVPKIEVEPKEEENLKAVELSEKPKESEALIENIRLDEISLKIKSEIENVIECIKKARRPTTEIQSLEKSLSLSLDAKHLVDISNNLTKINEILKLIETAESSLVTKKTSDMILVKNSIAILKEVITGCKNKLIPPEIKPVEKVEPKEVEKPKEIVLEKPKETEVINEKVPEIKLDEISLKLKSEIENVIESIKKARRPTSEIQSLEKSLSLSLDAKNLADIPNNLSKIDEMLKAIEVTESSLVTKKTSDMMIVKNSMEVLKENITACKNKLIPPEIKPVEKVEPKEVEKPKEIELEKPKETEVINEKVPEIKLDEISLKLKSEIENVIESIKKARRPTSEIQSLEKSLSLSLDAKNLADIPNNLSKIDEMLKAIEVTESSLVTKKTSDMLLVKNSMEVLKENITACKNKLIPPEIKPVEKVEQKEDEKLIKEVSKDNEKTKEIEPEKPKESIVEVDKIPELKLDEISLKIKSDIEYVIQCVKKARRPTPGLQLLEKTLNISLEVKVLVEISKSLSKIDEILKSIETSETSLITKKTSDMILVKNSIALLKETITKCKNKLIPPEIKSVEKVEQKEEEKEVPKDIAEPKEIEPKKLKDSKLEILDQPSEVLLEIHTKDLMAEYIVAIKQDIEEILVTIKRARRPSQELQTLHETLFDLKPKVDGICNDNTYFETVLNVVTKAKNYLLTKRTMELILLREKVTSLETSLTSLKSTIVTEVNGEIVEGKHKEEKAEEIIKVEKKISENIKIDEQYVEVIEQKKEVSEDIKKVDESSKHTELQQIEATKKEEIQQEATKQDDSEPQKPLRRRRQDEPAKIEEVKISPSLSKEETKTHVPVEPETPPIPTERKRQRQQQDITEIKSEPEPIKPIRRRRADDLKEEEKSLPRTPETRRKRMPTFIARLKNRSAAENSILKLTCAVSEPEVVAKWTKEGTILRDSDKYYIDNSNGVLSLEIKNACAQDAGEYYCFVSNSCGEIETSAFVTIFGEDVQPTSTTFTRNLKGHG